MRILRLLGGPAILLFVLLWVDVPAVLGRLADLRPGWLALALGVAVLQTVGSAWRWRFTAGRLGADLRMSAAVREYWLAGFLNQMLPGGVVGDVSRAVRHARDDAHRRERPGRRAVHGVILERLSGQIVVAIAAAASAVVLLTPASGRWVAGITTFGLLATVVAARLRPLPDPSDRRRFRDDVRRALLHPDALPVQLLTSSAVVASYVAVYLLAARAVGIETPVGVMTPLVTPVLLAMLVPVSVAGWGVREGAAAAIWTAAGLPAAEGVAISVAYGLVVLASMLPGGAVLALDGIRRRPTSSPATDAPPTSPGRGRRGGPIPAGGDAPAP